MNEQALKILKEGAVIPAVPLALTQERTFDEAAQRRLIRYYLEAGAGGIAAAVHTTQFEIRDPRHNMLGCVLRTVADEISRFERRTGRVIVRIAGVCGPSEQARGEALLARSLGYDAVLLSPGGLQAYSEHELLERTRLVAQHMPVIGFYLQAAVGGRRLSFAYWRSLCEIEGVVAIKAASFNRYQTIDLVRGCACSSRAAQVALYTGNDDHIIDDLLTPYRFTVDGRVVEKRFVGGLLGHWSVWTKKAVELLAEIRSLPAGAEIPPSLLARAVAVTDSNGAFFDVANDYRGCIAGVHEVLRRQGLLQGIWCLDPEETLSPGQLEEIDRVYRSYPELNDDAFVQSFLRKEACAVP